MSGCRRGLWVLGILALLFAPARWAESERDGHDGGMIGASVLAPTFSSAELPRVDPGRADDSRPEARGPRPQPAPFLLLVGLVTVAAGLVRRRTAVVDRDSVLAAPWRWRGPPLLLQLA